jgi:CheY-like chemotaxis protein
MATSLLLADDSPTIAKILGMALQSEDYEIRAALTAEDALKELKASPPFFFLVDLTLPGKSGYEFARLIRADHKLKEVRILLLASAFDPADENEVKACGADGVITKPFDPGELRRRLREVRDAPRSIGIPDVTGSLSGAPVVAADEPPAAPSPAALATAPEEPEMDANALLSNGEPDPLSILAGSGDADSLLSSATSPEETSPSEQTPVFDLTGASGGEFTNATVLLDPSALLENPENTPSQPVLDLSNSFTTPPAGTALDMSQVSAAAPANDAPATAPAAPSAPPTDEPLSANAQALAAFFAAEIDSKGEQPAASAPAIPEEDAFDASLSSIEWGAPKADLNEWSSAPPPKAAKPADPAPSLTASPEDRPSPAREPAPKREITHEISMEGLSVNPSTLAAPDMAPVRPAARSATPAPGPASRPSGASSEGGSFLFDTGGSNFRFAEDYVQRITKAFTGSVDEMTLGKDASTPVFHKASDDRAAPSEALGESTAPLPASQAEPSASAAPATDPLEAKHLPAGGGAWSPEEVKRIEQIVRDEVQMVVREIAEKVVWEVVPELAENLIKKELDKVLKEME